MQIQPQKCLQLALEAKERNVPGSGIPQIYLLWRYSDWSGDKNRQALEEIGFDGGNLIVEGERYLILPMGVLTGTGFAVIVPFSAIENDPDTTKILKHSISSTPQSAAHRKVRTRFWQEWWANNVPELAKPKS